MIFVEDINFVSWSRGRDARRLSGHLPCFAKVDKNYTSQTCPHCGVHAGKKDLSIRVHNCPECGYTQNRDVAAELVRNRGLENIAVGTTRTHSRPVPSFRRSEQAKLVRCKQPSNEREIRRSGCIAPQSSYDDLLEGLRSL